MKEKRKKKRPKTYKPTEQEIVLRKEIGYRVQKRKEDQLRNELFERSDNTFKGQEHKRPAIVIGAKEPQNQIQIQRKDEYVPENEVQKKIVSSPSEQQYETQLDEDDSLVDKRETDEVSPLDHKTREKRKRNSRGKWDDENLFADFNSSEEKKKRRNSILTTRPKPLPPSSSDLPIARSALLETDETKNRTLEDETALQEELTDEMNDMAERLRDQALLIQRELRGSVASLQDVDDQLDANIPSLEEQNKRLTELNHLSTSNCLGTT